MKLPADQLAAVISHERGHIRLGHKRQRIVWLFIGKWWNVQKWCQACWQQELDADRFAVENGHAAGMARFLRAHPQDEGSAWHPPSMVRLANIIQAMHDLKEN